jgi:hypothetical protein
LTQFNRQHQCGVAVDENCPRAVAAAIGRLVDDAELRRRCVANAAALAKREFSVPAAQQAFCSAVNWDPFAAAATAASSPTPPSGDWRCAS